VVREAPVEARSVGRVVAEVALGGHRLGVSGGGAAELRGKLERPEAVRPADRVQPVEHLLGGGLHRRLGRGAGRGGKREGGAAGRNGGGERDKANGGMTQSGPP